MAMIVVLLLPRLELGIPRRVVAEIEIFDIEDRLEYIHQG